MKNFKRLIALFVVMLLALSTVIPSMIAAPAGVATKAGETVTLTYEYTGIGGIYGTFTFSNPAIIKNVKYEITPEFQGILKNDTLAYFSFEPKTFSATVTFDIAETAVAGDTCDVKFTYETTVEGRVPDTANYTEETTTVRVEAIDYTALVEQINRVSALRPTKDEYTEASWNAMIEVYDEAIALVDHATLQSQVDTMAARLKAAIDGLVPKTATIDYTELNAQIARADALTEADYTAESWSAMKAVYNRAKALVNNASTQKDVDDMSAELKTAIDNLKLKPAPADIDYTALKAQIARADALKEADYTTASWSAMKTAYDKAKALVDNASVQKVVDDMTAELKAAIDGLVRKPTAPAIDYTALKAQIARADALKETDYTAESWFAMKVMYTQAKNTVDKATSQAQVDKATANLKAAIDALKLKPATPGIDYTELKKQIAHIEGLNKDDYTDETWSALMKIYDNAKKLVDKAKTQAEVDQMTADLKSSVAALVKKQATPGVIDYTELEKQIARADGLKEEEYTAESWAAMKKVYDEAKALIGNAKTQKEVDDMTAELKAAIDALEKAEEEKSCAWIWWIIIIILLIVVAIVVYIYIKKKKQR